MQCIYLLSQVLKKYLIIRVLYISKNIFEHKNFCFFTNSVNNISTKKKLIEIPS